MDNHKNEPHVDFSQLHDLWESILSVSVYPHASVQNNESKKEPLEQQKPTDTTIKEQTEEASEVCTHKDIGAGQSNIIDGKFIWQGFVAGHGTDDVSVAVDVSARLISVRTSNNVPPFHASYTYDIEIPKNVNIQTLRKTVENGILTIEGEAFETPSDVFFL